MGHESQIEYLHCGRSWHERLELGGKGLEVGYGSLMKCLPLEHECLEVGHGSQMECLGAGLDRLGIHPRVARHSHCSVVRHGDFR